MNDLTRSVLQVLKTVLRINALDPVEEAKQRTEATRQNRPTARQTYARDLTEYIEGPQALHRRKEPTT